MESERSVVSAVALSSFLVMFVMLTGCWRSPTEFRERVSGAESETGAVLRIAGIRPGDVVPRLTVRDVSGMESTVDFTGDAPSVLYVFSSTCVWCERNYDNIVALAASSSRFRFVGITEDDRGVLDDHLRERPLPFEILVVKDFSNVEGLDLSLTPQMALVGVDGIVEHAWAGALFGRALGYAEHVFGVRLPGVTASVALQPEDGVGTVR